MSLRSRAAARDAAPSATCQTCAGKRIVTYAAHAQSAARRCPSCFDRCDACGDVGYRFESDSTGAPVSIPCDCLSYDRRIQLYNDAKVPRRYVNAGLWELPGGAVDKRGTPGRVGTEDTSPSLKAAKIALGKMAFGLEPGDRGLGLVGPVGCGKTHLLAGLVRGLTLEAGVRTRFVEFTHLLGELREGFEQGKGSADIIAHVVEVPVLVIDELGKGLTTEWQRTILDELISKRYNANVTTFFSTNYPAEVKSGAQHSSRERFEVTTLEDRIGARMFSRLLEMCDLMSIEAPDFRKRSAR